MKKPLKPNRKAATKRRTSARAAACRERTVLLAVSGMSPAILTETVWALAHPPKGEEPVIPSEVLVISTTAGAKGIEEALIRPSQSFGGKSVWECLRDSILGTGAGNAHLLQLATPRIIEVPDPLRGIKSHADDIRSASDNIAAADFILETVRGIVENPENRLVASIAGGRKSMGSLLYAAMTLLGRERDRVTHVLVSEPYDQCRDFFYPTQPLQELKRNADAPDERLMAADAGVQLADIPFVPLRNRFADLSDVPGTFGTLVARYGRQFTADANRRIPIKLDYVRRELEVDGVTMRVREKALLILEFLLEEQEAGRIPPGQPEAAERMVEWLKARDRVGGTGFEAENIRHELGYLRDLLRRSGVRSWEIPVRSLAFPPFKLTVSGRETKGAEKRGVPPGGAKA